jgi:SAM-dependent methyltransferase
LRKYASGLARRVWRRAKDDAKPPAPVPKKSRDELHQYWKQPNDGSNQPQTYLASGAARRSEYLVRMVREQVPPAARILEVGCNAGRNLHYLYTNGFTNLTAIEISEYAVRLLRASFPDSAGRATILNRPLEEAVRTLRDGQFDLVFSMAVLEHIHTESEWTFAELARVTGKHLLTIEDEGCESWRHFPRRYDRVFEPLGLRQVRTDTGEEVIGLGGSFVARLFVKG